MDRAENTRAELYNNASDESLKIKTKRPTRASGVNHNKINGGT